MMWMRKKPKKQNKTKLSNVTLTTTTTTNDNQLPNNDDDERRFDLIFIWFRWWRNSLIFVVVVVVVASLFISTTTTTTTMTTTTTKWLKFSQKFLVISWIIEIFPINWFEDSRFVYLFSRCFSRCFSEFLQTKMNVYNFLFNCNVSPSVCLWFVLSIFKNYKMKKNYLFLNHQYVG